MEKKCKIGGERWRNRDVLNEDRISELPEALLLKILSSLPTENVIATSVLSKRWRSLWKMVPNLSFFNPQKRHTFSAIVCRSLLSNKAPFLESLHLEEECKCDALNIAMWISIAFARHVRKFVLDIPYYPHSFVRFPSDLCSFNDTLEILILKGSILLDLPFRVCFKSLRKLHLELLEYTGEESFRNLSFGCPNIKDLVLINDNDQTFTINVPSLQRLTIKGSGEYMINAPSLIYFDIEDFYGRQFYLIENAPKLVEAHIIDVSSIDYVNSRASLTSVKRLSLKLSCLQFDSPPGVIFNQLVSLELFTIDAMWWNLLSLMLENSPKLQILKFNGSYSYDKRNCQVGRKWQQPKCVPECLLFHLETFMWRRYEWQREDEKEVATYILKNSRLLKKATFHH